MRSEQSIAPLYIETINNIEQRLEGLFAVQPRVGFCPATGKYAGVFFALGFVVLFSGFFGLRFCVMVIFSQRETEGEKDYV